jgi:hypothetical protein
MFSALGTTLVSSHAFLYFDIRGEKRQYVYFGISFKERQENSELHPMTIQESLKYPCMLTTQTLSLVTLMMMSSVITNVHLNWTLFY